MTTSNILGEMSLPSRTLGEGKKSYSVKVIQTQYRQLLIIYYLFYVVCIN